MKKQMMANLPTSATQNGDVDIFKVLSSMPEENLTAITKEIDKNFKNLPETMVDQSAVHYVKSEYKAIGINTDKMQTQLYYICWS